jgi:hypothetical protein
VRYWRGAVIIIFLVTWPLVWFFSSLSIFDFNGQCLADSCGSEPTVIETILYLLYLFAPPVCAIVVWFIWRLKSKRGEA